MVDRDVRKIINSFIKILKEHNYFFQKIILFGSHARNLATKRSDIDLCVIYNGPEKDLKLIQQKLNGLAGLHGFNMDIIVTSPKEFRTNKISPILHEIRTYGKIILQNSI